MRRSWIFAPAVLLSCALVPAVSFAQEEISSARLEGIALAAPSDAAEAVASASVPAAPSPAPASPGGESRGGARLIGVGAKISLLGIGGEAALALSKRINVRGGFNGFGYSHSFDKDGINYAARLAFRSGEAHLDVFPFAGGFHVSPGLLFYNGNHIDAGAGVPPNQTFTLGGATYRSSATDPVSGTAKLEFNKVAPTFLIGFGNLIPRNRRRFSFTTEFGIAYTGSPRASLNLKGTACGVPVAICVNAATDPIVQSNVQSEVVKVNHDVSGVKVWPLASFGFGVNF